MIIPKGTLCHWCGEGFKVGDRVFASWSDLNNCQVVFHATPCWDENACRCLDFLPSYNNRELPS